MIKSIITRFAIIRLKNCNTYRITRYVTSSKYPSYAGHSKWANIKHIKAEKDGEKAFLFQKLSRQIKLAIQDGGGVTDPEFNTHLRNVVDQALKKNMPMSTIQGVIKKATQTKTTLKKYHVNIRYKQKVFMVCVIYTDRFSTKKMELAFLLRKAGASMIDNSSAFDEFGVIRAMRNKDEVISPGKLEEIATEDAIECDAEDISVEDAISGKINFICKPDNLPMLQGSLQKKGYIIQSAEHCFLPRNTIKLSPDELEAYEKFINKLQDAGIENIYHNVE